MVVSDRSVGWIRGGVVCDRSCTTDHLNISQLVGDEVVAELPYNFVRFTADVLKLLYYEMSYNTTMSTDTPSGLPHC